MPKLCHEAEVEPDQTVRITIDRVRTIADTIFNFGASENCAGHGRFGTITLSAIGSFSDETGFSHRLTLLRGM